MLQFSVYSKDGLLAAFIFPSCFSCLDVCAHYPCSADEAFAFENFSYFAQYAILQKKIFDELIELVRNCKGSAPDQFVSYSVL
jgi:hypothetical protein